MYFVVRRAFRNRTGPLPVGSVVEPTGIENFRYRLGEKHIVQVTEHNYDRYATFFKQRFGVDIPNPIELDRIEAEAKAIQEANEKAAQEAIEKALQEANEKAAEKAAIKPIAKVVVSK